MKSSTDPRPIICEADGELAKKVQFQLIATRSGFRQIDVCADSGTVTLSGPVPSFFLWQLATTTAKRVVGVRHVVDHIEVAFHGNHSH
jgi:osmotically-inducible protein OsmY